MFSAKATKIDKIFTVDLIIATYCQIYGLDFVNFCGLLRKYELYDNKLRTLISNLETEKLHHNSTYLIVEDFYIDFWEVSYETMSHVSF